FAAILVFLYFAYLQTDFPTLFNGNGIALFTALAVMVCAYAAMRAAGAFLDWYAEEGAPHRGASVTSIAGTLKQVANITIIVISGAMLLGAFGVEITPILASLGIAGLAVALAFQDTLANFFAGVYITADRPIKIGDYVKLENGDEGYVVKVGWRTTQIRTLPNNLIIVPNSKLAQSIITNYYSPAKEMSVVIPCSVSYDSDLKKVERVTIDVARGVQKTAKGAVPDFVPFVRFNDFGDSGIKFSVILRVQEYTDKYLVTHEFVKALHIRFKKEKIEIPYPKRDIYIRKG
ncbi:mechanosensitive ion channel protein MscS, partial [Candidatus Micrarchaeota archaeon CG10_big_fil_rev_8_21_14_0_10_59_7]